MARLTVLGALAMDRPIRLSGPLAPGARLAGVTLGGALEGRLGGGGANAGVALLKAGHDVAIAGVVAADAEGDEVLGLAASAGLEVSAVGRRPGVTRKTLIFVDPNGERAVIGLDLDRASLIIPELEAPGPSAALDGLFVRSAYPSAQAWAQACRGPVMVHLPVIGFPGLADVAVTSAEDMDAGFLAAPYQTARRQLGERLSWVVVTRGAAGAVAYGQTVQIEAFAPRVEKVVDTTGAGDIFAAGLLDALVAGAEMEAALRHACAWGAAAVGLDGSAPLEAPPALFPAFRPASS